MYWRHSSVVRLRPTTAHAALSQCGARRSQRTTEPSQLGVASVVPSGLNAGRLPWVCSVTNVRLVNGVWPAVRSPPTDAPVATSHSRVVLKPVVVDASSLPSGLYATPVTQPVCPLSAGPSPRWVATDHWRTMPDDVPGATGLPPGENRRDPHGAAS